MSIKPDDKDLLTPMESILNRIKGRRAEPARRLRRKHDLPRMEKELLEVLQREVKRLLDSSYTDALPPQQAKILLSYLEFIREYQAERDLKKDLEKAQKANEKETKQPKL